MTASTATLDRLLRNARAERCLLRDRWEEAAALAGRQQLRLAEALAEIKPATITRGHRVPCESRFELRPKDRRRLVEALLDEEGVSDREIVATVPGLSLRTFRRIRSATQLGESPPANRSSKRRKRPKRDALVGTHRRAYLDATSGANAAAERRFWALVGGAT